MSSINNTSYIQGSDSFHNNLASDVTLPEKRNRTDNQLNSKISQKSQALNIKNKASDIVELGKYEVIKIVTHNHKSINYNKPPLKNSVPKPYSPITTLSESNTKESKHWLSSHIESTVHAYFDRTQQKFIFRATNGDELHYIDPIKKDSRRSLESMELDQLPIELADDQELDDNLRKLKLISCLQKNKFALKPIQKLENVSIPLTKSAHKKINFAHDVFSELTDKTSFSLAPAFYSVGLGQPGAALDMSGVLSAPKAAIECFQAIKAINKASAQLKLLKDPKYKMDNEVLRQACIKLAKKNYKNALLKIPSTFTSLGISGMSFVGGAAELAHLASVAAPMAIGAAGLSIISSAALLGCGGFGLVKGLDKMRRLNKLQKGIDHEDTRLSITDCTYHALSKYVEYERLINKEKIVDNAFSVGVGTAGIVIGATVITLTVTGAATHGVAIPLIAVGGVVVMGGALAVRAGLKYKYANDKKNLENNQNFHTHNLGVLMHLRHVLCRESYLQEKPVTQLLKEYFKTEDASQIYGRINLDVEITKALFPKYYQTVAKALIKFEHAESAKSENSRGFWVNKDSAIDPEHLDVLRKQLQENLKEVVDEDVANIDQLVKKQDETIEDYLVQEFSDPQNTMEDEFTDILTQNSIVNPEYLDVLRKQLQEELKDMVDEDVDSTDQSTYEQDGTIEGYMIQEFSNLQNATESQPVDILAEDSETLLRQNNEIHEYAEAEKENIEADAAKIYRDLNHNPERLIASILANVPYEKTN